MEPTSTNCCFQPNVMFLLLTLFVTTAATAMLCVAIMTENWEYITWDKEKLISIEKTITNGSSGLNSYKLEWLLDGQVARVVLKAKNSREIKLPEEVEDKKGQNSQLPALFFTPIHGGIWTFCIALNGMQNLSISCALVCLIILSSSALIGAFGVTKRQISAVLVTGVMYLLAAIFATFSLTIIHFKRARSKADCLNISTTYGYTVEGVIVSTTALEKSYSLNKVNKYFAARIFTTGWSLHLGWGGAAMCILVSILWIFLSKIMRFNLINTSLAVI